MLRISVAFLFAVLSFTGGEDLGDSCEAAGYHGINGIEREVVAQIVKRIVAK